MKTTQGQLAALYKAYSRNKSEIVLIDVMRLSAELLDQGIEYIYLRPNLILELATGETVPLSD